MHPHKTYCAGGRRSGLIETGNPRTPYQMAVVTMVAAKRIDGTRNGHIVIRSEGGICSASRLAEV